MAQATSIEVQRSKLEQTRASIASMQTSQQETRAELVELNKEAKKLQRDIVAKAATINTLEREVLQQQRDIARLKRKEAHQSILLQKQRSYISRLVSGAWSLQHRPQLAAWMLPEKTRERALTARSLFVTTRSLKEDMDRLNTAMQEQETLRQDIISRRRNNEETRDALKAERKKLSAQLQHRKTQNASLLARYQTQEATMARLAMSEKTLHSFITALEQQRTEDAKQLEASRFAGIVPMRKPLEAAFNTGKPAPAPTPQPVRPKRVAGSSIIQAKGTLALPANGKVIGRFNERRGKNDRLKGLEIATLAFSTVTAPFEGEVLYTGSFLDYGNMVIIRHSHDYHTLVAGLSRIDVRKGQFLLDGEPIGAMGDTQDQRTLYLELRKASKAINPTDWFALTQKNYAKH